MTNFGVLTVARPFCCRGRTLYGSRGWRSGFHKVRFFIFEAPARVRHGRLNTAVQGTGRVVSWTVDLPGGVRVPSVDSVSGTVGGFPDGHTDRPSLQDRDSGSGFLARLTSVRRDFRSH